MSLESLINARKACRACMSNSPGELRNGAEYQFDPHVVSYWSQWLGSQRPEILIVGQDFTDWESFEQNQGVDDSKNGTNDSLRRLLALAGVLVQPAPQPDRQSPVHLTNAILCLKEPPKNRAVKRAWVRTCTERHLVKLIENLQPKYTIGLGGHGWRAVRQACALSDAPSELTPAISSGPWRTQQAGLVFAVAHCGPLGRANRSGELQKRDWLRIGAYLKGAAVADGGSAQPQQAGRADALQL